MLEQINQKQRQLAACLHAVESVSAIAYRHFSAVFDHVWVSASDLEHRIHPASAASIALSRTDWRGGLASINRCAQHAHAANDAELLQSVLRELEDIEDSYLRCDRAFKAAR